MRMKTRHEWQCISQGSRFPHHQEVRFTIEEGTEPLPDKFVIVKNYNASGAFHTGVRMGSNENSAMISVPRPSSD